MSDIPEEIQNKLKGQPETIIQSKVDLINKLDASIDILKKNEVKNRLHTLSDTMKKMISIGYRLLVFVLGSIANIVKYIADILSKTVNSLESIPVYSKSEINENLNNTKLLPSNVSLVSEYIFTKSYNIAAKPAIVYSRGGIIDEIFSKISALIYSIFYGLFFTTGFNVVTGLWGPMEVLNLIYSIGVFSISPFSTVSGSISAGVSSAIFANPWITIFICVFFAVYYFFKNTKVGFNLGVQILIVIVKILKYVFSDLEKLLTGIVKIITKLPSMRKPKKEDFFPAVIEFGISLLNIVKTFVSEFTDLGSSLLDLFFTLVGITWDIVWRLSTPLVYLKKFFFGSSANTNNENKNGDENNKKETKKKSGIQILLDGKVTIKSDSRFNIKPKPGEYISGNTLYVGKESSTQYNHFYGLSTQETLINNIEFPQLLYDLSGEGLPVNETDEVDKTKPYKIGAVHAFPSKKKNKLPLPGEQHSLSNGIDIYLVKKPRNKEDMDKYFNMLPGGKGAVLNTIDKDTAEDIFNDIFNNLILGLTELNTDMDTDKDFNKQSHSNMIENEKFREEAMAFPDLISGILARELNIGTKKGDNKSNDSNITKESTKPKRKKTGTNKLFMEPIKNRDEDDDVEMKESTIPTTSYQDSNSSPSGVSLLDKQILIELAEMFKKSEGFLELVNKFSNGELLQQRKSTTNIDELSKIKKSGNYLIYTSGNIQNTCDKYSTLSLINLKNPYKNIADEKNSRFYEQTLKASFFFDLSSYKYEHKRSYDGMINVLSKSTLYTNNLPSVNYTTNTLNTTITLTTTTSMTSMNENGSTTTTQDIKKESIQYNQIDLTDNWYSLVCWKLFSHIYLLNCFKLLSISDTYIDNKIRLKYSLVNDDNDVASKKIGVINPSNIKIDALSNPFMVEYEKKNPINEQCILFKTGILGIKLIEKEKTHLSIEEKIELLYAYINRQNDTEIEMNNSKYIHTWLDTEPRDDQDKNKEQSSIYNQYTLEQGSLRAIDELNNGSDPKKKTLTDTYKLDKVIQSISNDYIPIKNSETNMDINNVDYSEYISHNKDSFDTFLENPTNYPTTNTQKRLDKKKYNFFTKNGGNHTVIEKDFTMCDELLYDKDELRKKVHKREYIWGKINALMNQRIMIKGKIYQLSLDPDSVDLIKKQEALLRNVDLSIEKLKSDLVKGKKESSDIDLIYVLTIYFPEMGMEKPISLCVNGSEITDIDTTNDIGLHYSPITSKLSGEIGSKVELPIMYKLCVVLKDYKKNQRYYTKYLKNCFVSVETSNETNLIRTKAYIQPYCLYQFLIKHNLVNIRNVFAIEFKNSTLKAHKIANCMTRISKWMSLLWFEKYSYMHSLYNIILWSDYKKVNDPKIQKLKDDFKISIGYLDNIISCFSKIVNPFDLFNNNKNITEEEVNKLSEFVKDIETQINVYLLHKNSII